ncbi:MAG TPA: hypothetical protein VGM83_10625 [Devosiaceae bacterium]|jgi:hypothetical protein
MASVIDLKKARQQRERDARKTERETRKTERGPLPPWLPWVAIGIIAVGGYIYFSMQAGATELPPTSTLVQAEAR